MPTDNQYRKYAAAQQWLAAPKGLSGLSHDFCVFYAESDWDDPTAAWNEFRDAINSGSRFTKKERKS